MCSNSLAVNVDPNSYKLVMADTSQLCPVPPNNDSVDDKKVTSLLEAAASSYTPARNNMKHNKDRRRNTTSRGVDDNTDALRTSVGSNHSTDSNNSIRRHSAASTSGSSSTSGNNTTTHNGGATLRRKCQPLHKCATTNQSVSSIMRPSRYSMAMSAHTLPNDEVDNNSDDDTTNGKAPRRRSCNDSLPSQSMHSYFARPSGSAQRSFSLDDQWVASGVDFSSSVEVYVFRK